MTLVIMLITFICGIMILVTDRKSASSRWLSLILFFASLASFANAIQDFFPVFMYKNLSITLSKQTLDNIDRINAFLTQIGEHIICYFFFMYCVSYSGLFNKKKRHILGIGIFTITAVSFFSFPITTNHEKVDMYIYADYYRFLALWSVPAV
ncbi:hypothetical protein [Pseudobacteroides cellulosolvens]|uniref:Uncharacterized protein n=1 Tax=Pseudobacteroides cellulosolvens ATCC 35603 = DSM 2933 TaxID=398512 RepID=A0A0L6JPT1_9FIRM|nr:hypothetical protein [Pseudobacteroides cellulosolvens]KNY27794.1 hypothetical protein Bccel_3065 [Pseudobacteroides cellulosolvens ATCC 35603 = DSM 2933]